MPQISKRKLDKNLQDGVVNQFWISISKINTPKEASEFFSDVLTETEKVMLSKRLACAILLIRGRSATEIKDSIHLSYTTIGTIAAWVKNAKPKTRKILINFSEEKDWENILDKIEEILDKLPPRYGSDWHEKGKEKWQRVKERAAKRALR